MRRLSIAAITLLFIISTGCGSSGSENGGGGTSYENIGAALSSDGTEAVAGDKDGNLMTVSSGTATWKTPDGNDIVLYFGDDGYPTRAVVDGNVICFDGWDTTNNTVNVGFVLPDGTTKTVHNVAVDAAIMSRLATLIPTVTPQAQVLSGIEKLQLRTLNPADLANAVQFGATLIGATLCGVSIGSAIVSAGVTVPTVALACASTLMYFGTQAGLVGEDTAFASATGTTLTLIDTAQCVGGDPTACAGIVLTATATILETANATIAGQQDEIELIEMGLQFGGGAVQVTLQWEATVDLDLHVKDPSGEEIFYGHTSSASGGQLDHDDQDGGDASGPAKENIYWQSNAPAGTYTVWVRYYGGSGSADYQLSAFIDGSPVLNTTGTLTTPSSDSAQSTFVYPQ
ncbi:MAG: hypothetical protein WC956_01965 [bacterium]